MKTLETKQEIAIAINMHEMPVVRIDLADADEYGIKSQKVLIDNGKFRRLNPTDPDMPYLVRAEIRAFVDEKKFTFASYGCCLSNTFGYQFSLGPVSSGDKEPIEIALLPIVQHLKLEKLYSCQAVE